MSKIGKRLIQAAKEAATIAKMTDPRLIEFVALEVKFKRHLEPVFGVTPNQVTITVEDAITILSAIAAVKESRVVGGCKMAWKQGFCYGDPLYYPPASPAPVDETVVDKRIRMLEGTLNYVRTQAKANHPGVLNVIIANCDTALDGKHLDLIRSAALTAIKGE
ncbi:MAG: hypothetical protein Q8L53_16625 [Aestuariivirga sp.]|nr:hypothetical protein [Aestuariivirga sp.]